MVLAVIVVLLGILGLAGYQFWKHKMEQEQALKASRTYRGYVETQQPAPSVSEPEQASALSEERQMEQKLLAHPGVTPGQGFGAPGVKSTGVRIIDAIDEAQARQKQQQP